LAILDEDNTFREDDDDEVEETDNMEEEKPVATYTAEEEVKTLKFRNYFPRDENLRCHMIPFPPDEVGSVLARFEKLSNYTDDDALLVLAPKKPNWDLKRDIESKLNVLDVQTQSSILQLVRKSIKEKE